MLPAHVRDPEAAGFWIAAWFARLGAERVVPDNPLTVIRHPSGAIRELRVVAVVHFAGDRRLDVNIRLDEHLEPYWYTFDLVSVSGRLLGRHGHPEPVAFHHRHDPPGFVAVPASAPATFVDIEALLHAK